MDTSSDEFKPLKTVQSTETGYMRVRVPLHRFTPLKTNWEDIYRPIVEHMKLQIRFNPKMKCVELRSGPNTQAGHLQKAADFLKAFMLGFEVKDAITMLRVNDIYIDSFEVTEVKRLTGDHLSRAIGRIAGEAGKTRYTIQNATKTRIVIADTHIHILGSFQNIKIAKTAICNLILGSPSGKVYTQMRGVTNRMKNRY